MSKEYEFTKGKLEVQQVNRLVGKLLTVIDGSIPNSEQKEAVKSIITDTIWNWAREDKVVATAEQLKEISKNAETIEGVKMSSTGDLYCAWSDSQGTSGGNYRFSIKS